MWTTKQATVNWFKALSPNLYLMRKCLENVYRGVGKQNAIVVVKVSKSVTVKFCSNTTKDLQKDRTCVS